MATLREIRRRIQGVKSTQKITKAMKMVAAAKLRRAQSSIVAARPYARKIDDLMRHLVRKIDPSVNPLLVPREVKRVALIVIAADRGMCGAFNVNIVKTANAHIRANYAELLKTGRNVRLITVGKKSYEQMNKLGFDIYARHSGIFGTLDFSHARAVTAEAVDGFLKGEFDRVEVIYNEFKSIIRQKVVVEQLLPIPAEDVHGLEHLKAIEQTEYIYEPSQPALVDQLIPRHLNFQLWRMLLESNAAEQGARMTAMDNATTNANELISSLTLSYNKARQSSITNELLEIVSGAEALQKAG